MSLLIHPVLPLQHHSSSTRRGLRSSGANLLLSGLGTLAIVALLMAGLVAAWPRRQRR